MVASEIVATYIRENVDEEFHLKKQRKIESLQLKDITKRKNPYLFKAKGMDNAGDLIRSIMDATVSSGEETVFGNFMEKVAIHTCEHAFQGRKSSATGIDLEFENENRKYLISIKSGPNWGNSSQRNKMLDHFSKTRKTLKTSGGLKSQPIVFVEGCCYGCDPKPQKGTHIRLCGQDFWRFVSDGNEKLYQDIIEPFGHEAKTRSETLLGMMERKLNLFTAEFVREYCDPDGRINWDRLLEHNSGSRSEHFHRD